MDELRRLNSTADSLDEPFGQPFDRQSRRFARPPASATAHRVDLVVAVILTVVQASSSGFLVFVNVFLPFTFDACGYPNPNCNYTLGTIAWFIVPLVSVTVLIATIVMIVKNRSRSRWGWWVPLAGIVTTLIALFVAISLTNLAVGRPVL